MPSSTAGTTIDKFSEHTSLNCRCTMCALPASNVTAVDTGNVDASQESLRFYYANSIFNGLVMSDSGLDNAIPITQDVGVIPIDLEKPSELFTSERTCTHYPAPLTLPSVSGDAETVTIELSPCERAYRQSQMNLLRAEDPSSDMPVKERREYLRILLSAEDPIAAIREQYPIDKKKTQRGFGG